MRGGYEFERRVGKFGRCRGLEVLFETHGRGGFIVEVGFTTLSHRQAEIGKGLLLAMCKQLGINPKEFQVYLVS